MYVREVTAAPSLRGFGAATLADFSASLEEANRRWEQDVGELRGRLDAAVAPVADTVSLGVEVASRLDYSSPTAFAHSVAALASLAGPVGMAMGAVMEGWIKLAEWLIGTAPAYALQFQDRHYAEVDHWIATRVLGLPQDADRDKTLGLFYGAGWVPIYSLNEYCAASGSELCRWNGEVGIARTIEENRTLFSLIAGPRSNPSEIVYRNVSTTDYRDWIASDEGKASMRIADSLFDTLSKGGFRKMAWSDHNAWAFVSDGLIFVNNLPHDIDPGYRVKNLYCNVILVNITKLPDALFLPIADYVTLFAKGKAASVLDADAYRRVVAAAFGPNDEMCMAWTLLYLMRLAMHRRGAELFAPAVASLADRPALRAHAARIGLDARLVTKAVASRTRLLKKAAGSRLIGVPKTEEDKAPREEEEEKPWWKTPWPWVSAAAVAGIGYLIYRSRKE